MKLAFREYQLGRRRFDHLGETWRDIWPWSLFKMDDDWDGWRHEALEEAVELARKASKERWSKEELEDALEIK